MTTIYGICRLPLVPVRAEPSDRSEMVSQLLFGEHYQVIENTPDKKWQQIVNHFDGYQGWIDSKQHHQISLSYYQQINNSDFKITTDLHSTGSLEGHELHLALGSIVPITTTELFQSATLFEFTGSSKAASQKYAYEGIKRIALQYLNAPYLWGGKSPWGIDCSGFVQQVYRIAGYTLPRDAHQQKEIGVGPIAFQALQPGDLAFFEDEGGKINHVGIILEENLIVHASGKVRIDQLIEDGILNQNKVSHRMSTIKRVLK